MTSAKPFRDAVASEVEAAPGTREQKSARYVAARRFGGIPVKAFLLGDNDHSPMMQGIVDLTTVCWAVIDAVHAEQNMSSEEFARSQATMDAVDRMEAILCDHGCSPETPSGDEDA